MGKHTKIGAWCHDFVNEFMKNGNNPVGDAQGVAPTYKEITIQLSEEAITQIKPFLSSIIDEIRGDLERRKSDYEETEKEYNEVISNHPETGTAEDVFMRGVLDVARKSAIVGKAEMDKADNLQLELFIKLQEAIS